MNLPNVMVRVNEGAAHPPKVPTECHQSSHLGVGAVLQGGMLTSVTVLTADELQRISDEDLLRYIKRLSDRMEAAHRAWEAEGCFDAKALRDSLWTAEQAALRESWKRPEMVARREAEIEARMAEASA